VVLEEVEIQGVMLLVQVEQEDLENLLVQQLVIQHLR
tara:strand:+ start:31 stop:141 length:111 start_codon:yes stop_codon:yes gene_type:complete